MSIESDSGPVNPGRPRASDEVIPPGFERVGVAAAATLVPALLLAHGLGAFLHSKLGGGYDAVALSVTVAILGLTHALIRWRLSRPPAWAWLLTSLTAALLLAFATDGVAGALSVAACCTLQGWSQSRVVLGLPHGIDGLFDKRPWRAVGWSLIALLAVVQTARLAAHEADPEVSWWVTSKNPEWTSHLCSTSYFYAADLHEQGEANVYDLSHYPAFDPDAVPHATVENLASHVECAFQYPPPFLLLPRLALWITDDFAVIRPLWLALQGIGFLAVAVSLGLWVGGARGRLALWLLPLLWVAVPTLQTFQFGQFHLSAIALAMAGMLALEARRIGLGGALLGASVVAKIYPAVLLLLLVAQGRWRDLRSTLTWIAGFSALGLALLGPAPYRAFVFDHVPRLLDGSAFSSPHWDENTTAVMSAINLSVPEIPARSRLLGLPALPSASGQFLALALGLVILVLAWKAGRRPSSRSQAPILWLALLNLVVLQGSAAYVDYVPATSLWLLTLVSVEMARSHWVAVGMTVCWIHLGTLLGTFPLPDRPSEDWTEVISAAQISASTLLMTALVLALSLWCIVRTDRG